MNTTAKWVEIAPKNRKYIHQWEPTHSPDALVLILHGLGEHGGRYQRLADDLRNSGFRVLAFDQQGHGRSCEKRGSVTSYGALLDDIEHVLRWCQRSYPGLPTALLGHSMGGNLALNYALRNQFQPAAVISSSPMIRASREPGWWVELSLRMLMRLAPNLQLKSQIIPQRLMSDPDEQRALIEDELFHSRLTLRLGAGLLDSGRWLLDNASRLSIPTLLTHGTNDYLTSPTASQDFADRAGETCQFELLPGQLHDTFRDQEREHVIQLFVEFVRRCCTGVAT